MREPSRESSREPSSDRPPMDLASLDSGRRVTGILEVLDEIDLQATSETLAAPVGIYTVGTPLLSALTLVRILQNATETLSARSW